MDKARGKGSNERKVRGEGTSGTYTRGKGSTIIDVRGKDTDVNQTRGKGSTIIDVRGKDTDVNQTRGKGSDTIRTRGKGYTDSVTSRGGGLAHTLEGGLEVQSHDLDGSDSDRSLHQARRRRYATSDEDQSVIIGEGRSMTRGQKTTRSRIKRQYSISSGSGDELSLLQRKRTRKEASNDGFLIDKFLTILEKVKGLDKPKMTFNTSVIPEFDPLSKDQTVLTWLTKVEECAEIYGWEEKEIIHYSLPKLTGVAKTWYQGLTSILHTWSEWKRKLIESFPCREDYAELLTEMLAKKAKYGESLEHYYYAKINLLNRCNIFGRKAVDCLLYSIEDRAVRVGAQAAQFNEPEQVLNYFRTVKSGQSRENQESMRRMYDRRSGSNPSRSGPPKQGTSSFNSNITCYNCDTVGHPSYKCDKPLVSCTVCNRLGHKTDNCFRNRKALTAENGGPGNEPKQKQVSEVTSEDTGLSKYILDIKVNGSKTSCHVDLGSQCSLIRISDAKSLNLQINSRQNLPLFRGIGGNLICPIGVALASVEVQNLIETIDLYVVEDYVLLHPVLLGHSFTENPNVLIIKTPDEIRFQRMPPSKLDIMALADTEVPGNALQAIKVCTGVQLDCDIYVNGTLRGTEGKEYYLFPGQYEIKNGRGAILVYNLSLVPLYFNKGTLLTRSLQRNSTPSGKILNSFSVTFDDAEMENSVNCNPSLNEHQRQSLQGLLARYNGCFSNGLRDLGYTQVTEMSIELTDADPVVYRPYRMSYAERSQVRDMIQEMLDSSIIRESSSPYASPIVMVQKKTGEKRLCVDYRALNRKTKKDHYPLSRVEDQLDLLAGNTLFTSLDLASGYYQIAISEESRPKTAFVTPDGQYEYNRMPFGLVNAPSVFQRTINKILQEARIKYAIVYMDDILIPSKDFDEGLQRLEEVLCLLKKGGLTLKLSKCHFFLESIDFLGFDVSANGIRPGSRKVEAVSKFPTPQNQHDVRRFLGLSGFFRRFIKGYAVITAPLTDLLKKTAVWVWSNEQNNAFTKVKELLINRPVLALYDPKAETELHTDACKDGLAGILLQRNNNNVLQVVSYFSRKTNIDERKMHSYELETLAVVASLNRFRVYLVGLPFKIMTDCNALRSTLVKRDIIPRIARWWVLLQEFDCTIEYRPGARMAHADALSRNAVEDPVSELHILDVLSIQQTDQDWIATVQSADEEVKKIKSILMDSSMEEALEVRKNYKIKNDSVFRVVNENLKWFVPRTVRWQILKMNHDDVGHCGFEKTLQRIKEHYWFKKMRRFVKKYVSSCLECAHHKTPGGKQEGELHPIEKVSTPFHTIHADHLGPFIKSKKGNCYLLVIVDGFTKYVSINPVRNTKSITSVKIIKQYVSYFGVPTRLITDRGTSFTSKTFQDFVKSYGIKHIQNAVATPRANGQVERFNRTILDALSTSNHGGDDKSWDEHIYDIQIGINTTKHKTTLKSPSELLFGFNVTSRTEGKLHDIINETLNRTSAEELEDVRQRAGKKIKEQQVKDIIRYNKHRKTPTQYKEGDLVRVERQVPHDGKSQKLAVKYQGPYRIVEMLPNDRFLIRDTPLTRKRGKQYESIVAIDKITPWMNFNRDLESDSSNNDSTSENEEVVLFAVLAAFASAKPEPKPEPKPLVVEYPAYEYAAYTAPVAYSHSSHYDYHDHVPHAAYAYEYAPYSYYEYLRR